MNDEIIILILFFAGPIIMGIMLIRMLHITEMDLWIKWKITGKYPDIEWTEWIKDLQLHLKVNE